MTQRMAQTTTLSPAHMPAGSKATRPRLSSVSTPSITSHKTTYQVERFQDVVEEIPALWVKHWNTLGTERDRVKLDPDFAQYFDMDHAGVLLIVTARTAGRLIGYFFAVVIEADLHYRGLKKAWADIYYIDPAAAPGVSLVAKYRKLIARLEHELISLGVQKFQTAVKIHSDVGSLWDRLGYKPVERAYYRMLGD